MLCLVAVTGIATAAQAQDTVRGVRAATEPIAAHIAEAFPDSRRRFVNCPAENWILGLDGSREQVCEFRFVDRRATVRGSAGSAKENGRWTLSGFYPGQPRPHRWRRCHTGLLSGLPNSTPRRLAVFGEPCLDAKLMAGTIQYKASVADDRRLPGHFWEAWYGTNTLGFVTNTFRCVGRVHVHQGAGGAYGHEVASCRSQFGDRFVYVFDQDL